MLSFTNMFLLRLLCVPYIIYVFLFLSLKLSLDDETILYLFENGLYRVWLVLVIFRTSERNVCQSVSFNYEFYMMKVSLSCQEFKHTVVMLKRRRMQKKDRCYVLRMVQVHWDCNRISKTALHLYFKLTNINNIVFSTFIL